MIINYMFHLFDVYSLITADRPENIYKCNCIYLGLTSVATVAVRNTVASSARDATPQARLTLRQ